MTRSSSRIVATVVILLAAGPVAAQSPGAPGATSRPVSAAFLGGVSAGSGDAGASAGGVLTFDASDRIAVEARSVFLQRGRGTHGLELSGTALMTIARGARATPYIAIGGGLYRASFALGDDRLFGRLGSPFAPGTRLVPVRRMGFGMMTGGSQMPAFYANRLGQLAVPSNGRWMMRSFTDPVLTIGGGIRIMVTDRVYITPDVRALLVFAGGDRMILTNMAVGLGYRF